MELLDPMANTIQIKFFNSETKPTDLFFFEELQDSAVPLALQFQRCPSQGFAPIYEAGSGHNKCIKQLYWKLWLSDSGVLPNVDIHENFAGPDADINSGDVESFKLGRNEDVQASMDFATVTCWEGNAYPILAHVILEMHLGGHKIYISSY